jgi:hypothetical protein
MKKQQPKRLPELKDVLTVPEVAEMKGIARTTVTRALIKYRQGEEGGLRGEQRDRFWMITRKDAEAWVPVRQRGKDNA